jgi:hypothetical protein
VDLLPLRGVTLLLIFPLYQAGSTDQESIEELRRLRILVNLAYVGVRWGYSSVDSDRLGWTVADDLQCVPRCVSAGHSDVGRRSSTK